MFVHAMRAGRAGANNLFYSVQAWHLPEAFVFVFASIPYHVVDFSSQLEVMGKKHKIIQLKMVSLKLTGSLDNFLIFPYLINSEWSRFLPY
jgi:hypothetical protein